MTLISRAGTRAPGSVVASHSPPASLRPDARRAGATLDRPLIVFFALSYGLAWGIWLIEMGLARTVDVSTADFVAAIEDGDFELAEGSGQPSWLLYLMTRVQDFSFSIAGIVMIMITAGRQGLTSLRRRLSMFGVGARAYLIALSPLGLYAIAAHLARADNDGGAALSIDTLETVAISLHAGFLITLFLRGAMGEEIGLRGFALPRLQRRTTPFRASLVLGILWAGWHLPGLTALDPVNAVAVVLLIVGLSFIFTYLFNHSGGSLVPALLFHAAQNSDGVFETVFPSITGSDWETTAALGLLVMAIVAAHRVARQIPAHSTPHDDGSSTHPLTPPMTNPKDPTS